MDGMTDKQDTTESPRFSLAIDELIIAGFISNQEKMLGRLQALGFSRDEIIDRTRQLGLSVQFLKQCSINHSDVTLRECLRCSERFLSAGFQNRLCNRCRGKQ